MSEAVGKKKNSVIIVKTSPLPSDGRSARTAAELQRAGYQITTLVWERDTRQSSDSSRTKYRQIKLRIKAPVSNSLRVLAYWPFWWCFEFFWLCRAKWDVLHAINVDTIVPAIIVAKIKKKPVIYELFDIYEDALAMPRFLRRICLLVDKIFMRLADAVILPDEVRIAELQGVPNSNIVIIYNSPSEYGQDSASRYDRQDDVFTLCFAGLLHRRRRLNLDKVVLAISDMDKVRLVVAGYGDQIDEIKAWSRKHKGKIMYLGPFHYTESVKLTMESDAVVLLYDPAVPQNKFASPNKLFEAMMCGKPVIISKGTTMGEIVEKHNCGLVVDCRNVEEIKKAITVLTDQPALYGKLGANGRKAYQADYRWEVMKGRLLGLYQRLLPPPAKVS